MNVLNSSSQQIKIAKKVIMDKFLKSQYDIESQRTYPEDFREQPQETAWYSPSDEHEALECRSFSSITDFLSSSEN